MIKNFFLFTLSIFQNLILFNKGELEQGRDKLLSLIKNLTGVLMLLSFFAGVLISVYFAFMLKMNADKPEKVKKYWKAIKNVAIIDGFVFAMLFIGWISLQIVQSYLAISS